MINNGYYSFNIESKEIWLIRNIFTVDALISMFHCWFSDKDVTGETVRVFQLDFSKAFDSVNHQILKGNAITQYR